MSPESAELAKYASNAFLAVKLSFINSLEALCTRADAHIEDVTRCMGADARIGGEFLHPGPGLGRVLPAKDTAALVHIAHRRRRALPHQKGRRRHRRAHRMAAVL